MNKNKIIKQDEVQKDRRSGKTWVVAVRVLHMVIREYQGGRKKSLGKKSLADELVKIMSISRDKDQEDNEVKKIIW